MANLSTLSRPVLSSQALMLSRSRLIANIRELSSLSGEFYFYEPRERVLNSGSGSPLLWQSVSPNEADSLSMGELDRYSLALCSSLGSSITNLSPEEAVSLICERRLWQSISLLWLSNHCLSGDYYGAPHTASNARVLLEEFSGPELREARGDYGSQSVAIDPRYLSEDLLENLQSLENYPVLSEDDCSALELELQAEAWENWAQRDFSRALENRLSELLENDELAEQTIESLSPDSLYSLFHALADRASVYWESQSSPDQWIDCDRVAAEISDQELLSLVSSSQNQALQSALAPLLEPLLSPIESLLASLG
jgi:hypothetical protein